MDTKKYSILTILLFYSTIHYAQQNNYNAIYSGIPWFDNNLNTVSAHGACILKDNNKFYLFGELKSDTSNAFVGFSCYSSSDLMNWKFENVVLDVQESGILGKNRVGERVKVLKCPKTGEYIMLMHTDNLNYKDPVIGYATSDKITGKYIFRGPLLFNGEPIRRWDMGTFQDTDGSGYLIIHHGSLYKLSEDYKSIVEKTVSNATDGESPAIFKKNDLYYWLGSGLTGWERNDNFYYTAKSLSGPWTPKGNFAPKGTLTWNSQTTYVLAIPGTKDTTYIFMGDRWSNPRQRSAATYVWQPMIVEGDSISIPVYYNSWCVDTKAGVATVKKMDNNFVEHVNRSIQYKGIWEHTTEGENNVSSSNTKGATFNFQFKGTQIGLYSMMVPDGGYAEVSLLDKKGVEIIKSTIDLYCQYPVKALVWLSPKLKQGKYNLKVTVLGDKWGWVDKHGNVSGSKGYKVTLDKLLIID